MQRLVIPSELGVQSNFGVTCGKGVVFFTQQSTKKARKGAILDAAIGGSRGAKDCGDCFLVEKGWFVETQQKYAKRFI
eukprot:3103916-Ditylum_brightwellii.AAC.1